MSTLPYIAGKKPAPPYNTLAHEFLLDLYQRGHSKTTIQTYGWHLYKLCTWLTKSGYSKPCQVSKLAMRERGALVREQYSPATQKQNITVTKAFFQFLVDEKICRSNPADVLHFPKILLTEQRTFTPVEIRQMLASCDSSPIGIRNRAIIVTFLETGIRAAELIGIKLQDINLAKMQIAITGKGGNREVVFLSKEAKKHILKWWSVRGVIAGKNVGNLFVSFGGITPGHALTSRGVGQIIRNIGKRAKVHDASPHAFRRSFATLRIKLGQPTRSIQHLGRWKDLKTFERYTLVLMNDDEFARQSASSYSIMTSLYSSVDKKPEQT